MNEKLDSIAGSIEILMVNIGDIIPYVNNAKTHPVEQVEKIAASIKEFGFNNPILVDNENGVIAGHGRLMAAQKLKLEQVPTINLSHLTETQKKAYILADNRLGEVGGTEWDFDLVSLELESLVDSDFSIDVTGFDDSFLIVDDTGNPYTMEIEAPTYEPKNEKPIVEDLTALDKTSELVENIKKAYITKEEKDFLLLAAERHTVFDFGKIADYYAHSNKEMQDLMEQSALVIIDYNKALENGFVQISKNLNDQYEAEQDEG